MSFSFSLKANSDVINRSPFEKNIDNFNENIDYQISEVLKNSLNRRIARFKSEYKITDKEVNFSIPSYVERDTVFNLRLKHDNYKNFELTGKVYSEEEKKIVEQNAYDIFNNIKINIDTFPFDDIKDDYGISKKPFSNLLVKPENTLGENLASQIRLGTPLNILEISNDQNFVKVRSQDDKYISWINRKEILECNEEKYNSWLKSPKITFVKTLNKPTLVYFGTRLPYKEINNSDLKAILPEGKEINISKDFYSKEKSFNSIKPENIISTAKKFLPKGNFGKVTYLWGGNIGNEMDCSGFTQTVFRANGILLPRDADQQQAFTSPVGENISKINELKPADLIFFSKNRKYPFHVGIYLGDGLFIHSTRGKAGNGVTINNLKGKTEADKYLQEVYFGGGRIIN